MKKLFVPWTSSLMGLALLAGCQTTATNQQIVSQTGPALQQSQTLPASSVSRSQGTGLLDKSGFIGSFVSSDNGIAIAQNGRALFLQDNPNICDARCLANWSPYLVGPQPRIQAPFSAVQRSDGKAQWSYLGRPLFARRSAMALVDPQSLAAQGFRRITAQEILQNANAVSPSASPSRQAQGSGLFPGADIRNLPVATPLYGGFNG